VEGNGVGSILRDGGRVGSELGLLEVDCPLDILVELVGCWFAISTSATIDGAIGLMG
jgi:hypothetical protein